MTQHYYDAGIYLSNKGGENMNKKIIALQGASNTGKSCTLKLLIDIISNNQHCVSVLFTGKNDMIVVAEINGKKLGITTYGDTREELENDFKKIGICDLYVCASRSKGGTVDFLEKETVNGLLIIHGKWYFESTNYNCNSTTVLSKINCMQANEIYNEIIDILK